MSCQSDGIAFQGLGWLSGGSPLHLFVVLLVATPNPGLITRHVPTEAGLKVARALGALLRTCLTSIFHIDLSEQARKAATIQTVDKFHLFMGGV